MPPLPFLKPKTVAGVIMSVRKADGGSEEKGNEGEDAALEAHCEDIIRAMHSKDAKSLAKSLRAAFEALEMEPHSENEDRPEPHSYDASKE